MQSRGEVRTLRGEGRPKAYFRALGDALASVVQCLFRPFKRNNRISMGLGRLCVMFSKSKTKEQSGVCPTRQTW